MYKAIHISSGTILALKIVPVANDLEEIMQEINVMKEINSPNIVQYYGRFFKDDTLWVFYDGKEI